MERIKQALEKAREQRLKASENASREPVSISSHPSHKESVKPPVLENIVYRQTGSVPVDRLLLAENRILEGNADSTAAAAYSLLRTQVLQQMQANNWNTLAITSTGPDEGKTLTAINLALSIAKEVNSTVLLVDADLSRPKMHQYFGLQTKAGLSSYLKDESSLEDILIRPEHMERFILLPAGPALDNSAEMLNSPKMQQLVTELGTRYPNRIVIFDLPPVLSASDALAFSPYVDASLLVVEEGKTEEDDLIRAIGLLEKENLLGTVLNKAYFAESAQKQSAAG